MSAAFPSFPAWPSSTAEAKATAGGTAWVLAPTSAARRRRRRPEPTWPRPWPLRTLWAPRSASSCRST
eukprot:5664704-Alexandrium_andersonii.AAC.1